MNVLENLACTGPREERTCERPEKDAALKGSESSSWVVQEIRVFITRLSHIDSLTAS